MIQQGEAMQASFVEKTFRESRLRLRADAAVYLSIALYFVIGFVFLSANHAQENARFAEYLKKAMLLGMFVFPLGALTADAISVLHRFDRRRGLAFRRAFSPRRFASLLTGSAMLAGILLFEGVFTSVKNTLVVWRGGFHFDRALAGLDAFLHFGVDPWRIAAPLMDFSAVRIFVSYNYGIIWFLIAFGAVYFVASSPKADAVRSRYLLSFMLVWVLLGNMLAGLFMSAGPAFYAQATGDSARFAGLAAKLAEGSALGDATGLYQSYLWSLYESGTSGFASGISAFPSVHVGLMVMNTLFAWDANRRLGWAMTAYSLLIFASSVGLGWHYAVDGYASAIIVIVAHAALKRAFGWAADARSETPAAPVTAH
jgi:PAP2 superfamily